MNIIVRSILDGDKHVKIRAKTLEVFLMFLGRSLKLGLEYNTYCINKFCSGTYNQPHW